MTSSQLNQIKQFAKDYYQKMNDPYHPWEHALLTAEYAKKLAKPFKNINDKALESACILHDIGRIKKDEGHPEESAKIAKPFLKKIGLDDDEIELILRAIEIHAKERINEARTIEDKLLFDADKLQILSVYGFLRVWMFVVDKRRMNLNKALDFMWDYVQDVHKGNYMQTPLGKKIVNQEMKKIEKIVKDYKTGLEGKLK
jgi:putative nucleotidyltransferase with HDIG domain